MSIVLLGIDIGTSKIAATIIDEHAALLASASRQHHAEVEGLGAFAEQRVERLVETLRLVLHDLPEELRRRVGAVGVTGQAHGIALFDRQGVALSNLITWQDQRCTRDEDLRARARQLGYQLHSGYGCATLQWLARHGGIPADAHYAATVQDYLAYRLCGAETMRTDPTTAASMGLFDLKRMDWDLEAMSALDVPAALLPHMVECSTSCGTVQAEPASYFGIPADVPVAVPLADSQASLLATLRHPERELALTIGTGGQISVVLPTDQDITPFLDAASHEVRPYPGNRYALVASILAGGAAWLWLARFIEQCLESFNLDGPSVENIFVKLNELGLAAEGTLSVVPHFNGERYDPALRGSIHKIDANNFTLGNLARGLSRGILENLRAIMPPEVIRERTRIMCSGNAFRLNPLLREMAREVFRMPVHCSGYAEEAAVGAALNAHPLLFECTQPFP